MLHRIWASVSATQARPEEGFAPGGRALARRLVAPVRVAAWRIARRPARVAIVAAGVAVATATLAAVSSGGLVLRERALHRQLDAVAPKDRSFRADEFGLAFSASPRAEKAAERALSLVTSRPPVREVEFRPLRFGRHLVELTAVEDVQRFVRLASGRLPRTCRPERCEVLELGSGALPHALTVPDLRLAVVGRASLTVPAVLGDFAEPSNAALVAAADVEGLAALPALESIFRTASWAAPIEPDEVHEWEVPHLLSREANAQAILERADPAFRLSAPDDAFSEGRRLGTLGSRRMLLVGGEIAALLLGFTLLAAIGLRRTLLAEWRRLEERAAGRPQLWLFLVTETGGAALAGALGGVVLGVGAAAWAGTQADVATGDLLAHGFFTPATLLLIGAAWIVATVVLVLAVRWPEQSHRGPVRMGDVIAVAALAAALVVASRGSADDKTLADNEGSTVLLLFFPALVCLFAALMAVRLLAPLVRAAELAVRKGGLSLRLALLSLARAPARTAVAVAFLVVSVGLALLAAGYRATLERGVQDEAAYRVPLDYALTPGTRPVDREDARTSLAPLDYAATQGSLPIAPLDAASLARYRSLAPGVAAYPVLRRFGDVPGIGTGFSSPVLLGLEPKAIRAIHGWRSDFGSGPPEELARILGREPPVELAGARVPRGATGFALAARMTGAEVDLFVAVEKPSGEIVIVPLRHAGSTNAVPQSIPANGRVVALELSLTQAAATALAHRESEGTISGAQPLGTLELGPLVAFSGARRLGVVTDWRGWIGRTGARRLPGSRTTLRYALTGGQIALFRPRAPTDAHPIPLVVSPDVARSTTGGLITIENGQQHITGRVVAVARRFPGTADGEGSFVLAEESHLQTALDASQPGTGFPDEVWLDVPGSTAPEVESELARAPLSTLTVASRRELERQLRSDPLSRSIAIALGVGALVALGLAVLGLWLTMLGDVADERGELYDLEAQGVRPAELRNQLRFRALLLAALGLAGGIALGIVLSSEVVRLLQVSASGATPVPPLVREVGWLQAAIGLFVMAAAGVALVETTVRRAFRESTPALSGEIE